MIICCPQLGLSPESNLGGEVYDREILTALDKLGVESLIILPFGKKHPKFKNAKIYFLPIPFVYPPWLFNFLVLPYLIFLKHKYKFDILRVHDPHFIGFGAVLFKKIFNTTKLNFSYLHLESENKFWTWLDRKLLPSCDLITTISESSKKEIVDDLEVESGRIEISTCGVDIKYHPKEKNKELISKYALENKKVLLYLGQLIPRKNLPFLLKIIGKLPQDYKLLICGDGPLKNNLEEIIEKSDLRDKVILTGKVAEDLKVDYYNLADVFVYPSAKEGFGLSVCEALSCGKKVIATNIPVFNEIKSRGIVLLSLNPTLWVTEISKPINHHNNFQLPYSWDKSAQKLYEIYKQQAKQI